MVKTYDIPAWLSPTDVKNNADFPPQTNITANTSTVDVYDIKISDFRDFAGVSTSALSEVWNNALADIETVSIDNPNPMWSYFWPAPRKSTTATNVFGHHYELETDLSTVYGYELSSFSLYRKNAPRPYISSFDSIAVPNNSTGDVTINCKYRMADWNPVGTRIRSLALFVYSTINNGADYENYDVDHMGNSRIILTNIDNDVLLNVTFTYAELRDTYYKVKIVGLGSNGYFDMPDGSSGGAEFTCLVQPDSNYTPPSPDPEPTWAYVDSANISISLGTANNTLDKFDSIEYSDIEVRYDTSGNGFGTQLKFSGLRPVENNILVRDEYPFTFNLDISSTDSSRVNFNQYTYDSYTELWTINWTDTSISVNSSADNVFLTLELAS